MFRIFKSFLILCSLLTIATQNIMAQSTIQIPRFNEIVIDKAPVDFKHEFESLDGYNLIREYIPKEESLDEWSKMLSIMRIKTSLSLKEYSDNLFANIKSSCVNFQPLLKTKNLEEYIFEVRCRVKSNVTIPGGKRLKWEDGVYRFVKISNMIYQIHYVTHGAQNHSKVKSSYYIKKAYKEVNEVNICNLSAKSPCQDLDTYVLGMEVVDEAMQNTPPCQQLDEVPCNPTVVFLVLPTHSQTIDKNKKTALIVLDLSKKDLRSYNTFKEFGRMMIASLKSGAPETILIIRAGNPNAIISKEDRLNAASFTSLLRTMLMRLKLIDKENVRLSFRNFK